MTTAPIPEPEPDPGPLKPSGGENTPSIDPDPGEVDRTTENPDSQPGSLADRDASQVDVDREMADGVPPHRGA